MILGRFLAAISYLGLTGALVPLAKPDNPFVVKHARLAVLLHLLRIALIAPVLVLPIAETWGRPAPDVLLNFALNLSLLVLLGLPLGTLMSGNLAVWIGGVLAATWAMELFGMLLALSGRTADWHAFFHADWPNHDVRERPTMAALGLDGARDKAAITELREKRLARMRSADSVASQERRRQSSLGELQDEFSDTQARRAHLTQLLQLGEISERRYDEGCRQLDARLAELSAEIAILGARRVSDLDSRTRRELPTDMLVHVPLQTLAISGRNGLPLRTYGNFQLDEALVTGILSAFNSLSEEVFGAQVHKTHLAEGQVLLFIHARYTVTLAVFDEEPSPTQLRLLRDLVDQFENLNNRELTKPAPNPARLKDVTIPFTFVAATA